MLDRRAAMGTAHCPASLAYKPLRTSRRTALPVSGLRILFGIGLLVISITAKESGHQAASAVIITLLSVVSLLIAWRRGSPLFAILIVAYALPFTTLLGYVGNSSFSWGPSPTARGLSTDASLIISVGFVGLIGFIGLLLGFDVGSSRRSPHREPSGTPHTLWRGTDLSPGDGTTMSRTSFVLSTLAVLALSWLGAPAASISEATYGSSSSLASRFQFSGSLMIAFVVIVLLRLDVLRSERTRAHRWKLAVLYAAVLFIVFELQLLRGDRESVGLVLALGALEASISTRTTLRNNKVVAAVAVLMLLMAFVVVGSVRSSVATAGFRWSLVPGAISDGLQHGTWRPILATNLAVEELRRRDERPLLGLTYAEYVPSLIPGPIARLVNLDRPLSTQRGPAWWSEGVGIGGTHVVNVPSRNFGPVGAGLALAAVGYLCGVVEAKRRSHGMLANVLYFSTIAVAPYWFWYGDMYFIRVTMVAILVAAMYRVVHLKNVIRRQPRTAQQC